MGVLCLVSLVAALDYKYHHSEELEAYLKEVHAAYPALTHLHSIGRSVEGGCGGEAPAGFPLLGMEQRSPAEEGPRGSCANRGCRVLSASVSPEFLPPLA